MATRTVSTKLAIEGESEYRASLQRVNTQLKEMQSELRLTESQYQTNANTLDALRSKSDALKGVFDTQKEKVALLRSAYENAKSATQQYADQKQRLTDRIDANNKALEKLKTTTGDTSKEEARLRDENAKLQAELAEVDAKLQAAEKGTSNWKTQLNNAEIQLNDLDAEIQKNDKYMEEAEKSADGCATSIDEFGREVDDTAESVKNLGTILASAQIKEFAEKITAAIQESVNTFADFEAGMARVKRTTGMSDAEIAALGDRFRQLSTEIPVTAGELAAIAESAGQLGIRNSEIESFTVTVEKLSSATNIAAEKTATMVAQFANVTGLNTQDDYSRLASTVAALGDSSAVTGEKILDMAQGMGAIGKVSGMSAKDVLAIATAVGSAGVEAAAGSTSMNRLMQSISRAVKTGGDELNTFASISGMTKEQFVAHWETDAVGALDAFIGGLGDVDRNGKSSIELLDDLGISQQKERAVIQSLAEAQFSLGDAIEAANIAWDENRALDEKAATAAETLSGKMQMLESASDNVKIAFGQALAPVIEGLVDTGTSLLNAVTDFIEKHPALTEALGLVAGGFAGIVGGVASFKSLYKAADFLGMAGPLKQIAESASAASGGLKGILSVLGGSALTLGVAATALVSVAAIVDEIHTVTDVGYLGEGHTLEEYANNVEDYRQEIERLQEEYNNLAIYGGDLSMVQNELDHATIGLAHAQEELAAAEEAAAQAEEAATASMQAQSESTEYQKALNQAMAESISSVAESFRQAYDACRESLEGQIGLFDSYTASISEDTDTAQEMLNRWAQQTENLASYTENLQKAAQYGLDLGLVQSLADGSTESAGYLATIIAEIENCANNTGSLGTSAEDAVAVFNAAFAQTEQAKDKLATTMTVINEDLASSLAEMEQLAADVGFEGFRKAVYDAFSDVGIRFSEIAGFMGDGLTQGMAGKEGDVAAAAEELADAGDHAFTAKEGINSPSTVWRGYGENLIEGLVLGIDSGASEVTGSVSSMGENVNAIMQKSGESSTNAFLSSFRQMSAEMSSLMAGLQNIMISGMAGLDTNMFIIGNNAVVGMINGIYSRSGDLYAAMYSVTANAIAAAKSAADVHSPSKKTQEIFENVGEGMIVGIESKRQKVAESTRDVVREALKIDEASMEKLSQEIGGSFIPIERFFKGAQENASMREKNVHENRQSPITINLEQRFEGVGELTQEKIREVAEYTMEALQNELERAENSLT